MEPHHLLIAESLVADGDVDLANQYAARDYERFHPRILEVDGQRTEGRIDEPHGIGFALLLAPAYALAGPTGAELAMAALAALAFVLASVLARRLVPEPWATTGVLLVALSPPVLARSTAVSPELAAGALLALACVAALRVRAWPRLRYAYGGALALALLPWLGTALLVPAVPLAMLLVRWTSRSGRRLAAIGVAEVMVASLLAFVTVNDVLYGGFTPYAALDPGTSPTGATTVLEHLERAPRLVGLWIDREAGLLRWAPVLALAFYAAWVLWRSRRERLAKVLPERLDTEMAAALALAICGTQLLVAAFAAPVISGEWFPGRHLAAAAPCAAALTAWGLRYAPRAGALLGALTLVASAWLVLALRLAPGSLSEPGPSAPWGPPGDLLPRFGTGSAWATVVAVAAMVALLILVAREWQRASRPLGQRR